MRAPGSNPPESFAAAKMTLSPTATRIPLCVAGSVASACSGVNIFARSVTTPASIGAATTKQRSPLHDASPTRVNGNDSARAASPTRTNEMESSLRNATAPRDVTASAPSSPLPRTCGALATGPSIANRAAYTMLLYDHAATYEVPSHTVRSDVAASGVSMLPPAATTPPRVTRNVCSSAPMVKTSHDVPFDATDVAFDVAEAIAKDALTGAPS